MTVVKLEGLLVIVSIQVAEVQHLVSTPIYM
jgi:hypothetical protein